MKKILISFPHGLGDAVQFTIVLAHLERHRPDWEIDLIAFTGKHTAFGGFRNVRNVYAVANREEMNRQREQLAGGYNRVFDLPWHEAVECWKNHPSTKAERCLYEFFQITPDPDLCARYRVHVRPEIEAEARLALQSVFGDKRTKEGRFPVCAIHYQGNTSQEAKNIGDEEARWILNHAEALGLAPLVLDWESPFRSCLSGYIHFPVHHPYWKGTGTGDAERVAALIGCVAVFVGIDSGPQKCAAATKTPTVAIWRGFHPLHYLAPAENVVNVLPRGQESKLRGDQSAGKAYFESAYRVRYSDSFLSDVLSQVAEMTIQENYVFDRGMWLRRDNLGKDVEIVKDVIEDDCYKLATVPRGREVVVDIGAHIGSFATLVRRRSPNSLIVCVEACPENHEPLEMNVGKFAKIERAACTYEKGVALLNAVYPHCASTGGSIVAPISTVEEYGKGAQRAPGCVDASGRNAEYWADLRPLPTVTLEELAERHGFDEIDILKLDCEGSEFSILSQTTMRDRIKCVVGEYHGRARFDALAAEYFQGWRVEIQRGGEIGLFRLTNPKHHPA